jgi:translation initiation factor 1
MAKYSRLVYSTDGGRVREPAERSAVPKRGPSRPRPSPPDDGVVRLFREKGGRGGKVVTVIRGLPERGAALEARAGELKRLCGAGGTVQDGTIEIQGDHRERIAGRLRSLGYTVKLAGG